MTTPSRLIGDSVQTVRRFISHRLRPYRLAQDTDLWAVVRFTSLAYRCRGAVGHSGFGKTFRACFCCGFWTAHRLWDANARKTAGIRRWLPGATFLDGLWAFVSIVIVGAITYVSTWAGWLLTSGGYYRNWGANHPTILPDWLTSLVYYHVQSTTFHTELESAHNYASSAWIWPFAGRPVSFFYRTEDDGISCAAERCSAAILDLPNPLIW